MPLLKVLLITFLLAYCVIFLLGWIKIFQKAGQPSWAAIIPGYNFVILLHIIGKSKWWLSIPFINLFIIIQAYYQIGILFDRSRLFSLFLLTPPLNIITLGAGVPILGFGSSLYQKSPQHNPFADKLGHDDGTTDA